MRIVVCIRQDGDGEISPFDACAYECALRIPNTEVILLSMGPPQTAELLTRLTRLGAKRAILLSDPAFAGADTLATARTLSLAIRRLKPELILCGRQTLIGDTAQTGPMLSYFAGTSLITNVMSIDSVGERVSCTTRDGVRTAELPALLTVERICTLRFPSIFSKAGEVEILDAAQLGADPAQCGLVGSPTRVIRTYENQSGRRRCSFIRPQELADVIARVRAEHAPPAGRPKSEVRLSRVFVIGEEPLAFAASVSDDITVVPRTDEETIAALIAAQRPNAVLWPSDAWSKACAARVSARLGLGLCADCTALETDGEQLIMIRPALSGSIIARIVSRTVPAMATVRTAQKSGEIIVAAGFGVRDQLDAVRRFAASLGAEFAASRKLVDSGLLPYGMQIGLTGRSVSPPLYIAVGISGAVHHTVGMERAGTVIAVNPDRGAPIFNYADYGIIADFTELPL